MEGAVTRTGLAASVTAGTWGSEAIQRRTRSTRPSASTTNSGRSLRTLPQDSVPGPWGQRQGQAVRGTGPPSPLGGPLLPCPRFAAGLVVVGMRHVSKPLPGQQLEARMVEVDASLDARNSQRTASPPLRAEPARRTAWERSSATNGLPDLSIRPASSSTPSRANSTNARVKCSHDPQPPKPSHQPLRWPPETVLLSYGQCFAGQSPERGA